ncbi:MAG TPA: toll/interleukin-1 receptor domain-containing protein [Bryobacteraceae bacterium]|nr:toll/interleukin-1 receptor domain-containing protein [Bryobacteraceae bacterium]
MNRFPVSARDSRPKAFISYAHEDHASAAWIAVELDAVGISVFRDEEQLLTGDRLSATLARAIAEVDVFVLIATADGLASVWTRREFEWATQVGCRICFLYWSTVPAERWPELADLLGVDVGKSLSGVIPGTINALPGFAGDTTRLDVAIERRGVDLVAVVEFVRRIAEALSRHIKNWHLYRAILA